MLLLPRDAGCKKCSPARRVIVGTTSTSTSTSTTSQHCVPPLRKHAGSDGYKYAEEEESTAATHHHAATHASSWCHAWCGKTPRGFCCLLFLGWCFYQSLFFHAFTVNVHLDVVTVVQSVPPKRQWIANKDKHHGHHGHTHSHTNLTCMAWRSTQTCSWKTLGAMASKILVKSNDNDDNGGHADNGGDLPCHTKIPPWQAGYCEMQTENHEVIQVFQKSCPDGFLPEGYLRYKQLVPSFSCDMVPSWLTYKQRMLSHVPTRPLQFTPTTKQSKQSPTRGIVMQVYPKVLASTFAVIKVLRELHNCTLPIELWSIEGEVTETDAVIVQLVQMPNIQMRFITDPTIQSYMSKPYSIAYSQFDQVLFLDSDNFPFHDPSYLFDTLQFQQYGAMFWKDYWRPINNDFYFTNHSMVWELLDIPKDSLVRHEMEMESGQVVLDRRTTQTALHALLFLASTYSETLQPLDLALGDKDLFRLAFHATNTPFHYIHHPPSLAGHAPLPLLSTHKVCGQTMVQPDPMGQPLFFHRNQAKISNDEKSLYRQWTKGTRFIGTDPETQYAVTMWLSLYRLNLCFHPAKDEYFQEIYYRGTEVETFEIQILDYAKQAQEILQQDNLHTQPLKNAS